MVPVMEDSWWVLSWGMLGPGLRGRGWGVTLFPKGISSPSVELVTLSSPSHPLRVTWGLLKIQIPWSHCRCRNADKACLLCLKD